MFEEEAQQYAENKDVYGLLASISEDLTQYDFGTIASYDIDPLTAESFKDGATVGYNKAKKEKWHKVADGDYPPCEKGNYTISVLTDKGDIAYYSYDYDCRMSETSGGEIAPPIAWCELPTYKEEQK